VVVYNSANIRAKLSANELFNFWIHLVDDSRSIVPIAEVHFVIDELEAVAIERKVLLMTTDVVDLQALFMALDVCLGLLDLGEGNLRRIQFRCIFCCTRIKKLHFSLYEWVLYDVGFRCDTF